MRIVLSLLACVATSIVAASDPGQPLDCSDWVFLEPGLSCGVFRQCADTNASDWCAAQHYVGVTTDSLGQLLRLRVVTIEQADCGGAGIFLYRLQVIALDSAGQERVLAYVNDRCGAPQTADSIAQTGTLSALTFDAVNGRLMAPIMSYCQQNAPGHCTYPNTHLLVRIDGFASLFDVLQTFTPTASALGFHVPYMPEGMAAADRFDTFYGALTHPLDFTQAHGLACGYPTAAPHVGDYLEVADPLPDPAPGTGRYYVTSATYQGQTRYGRKTSGGVLSGRDPALLPACQ